MSSSEQCAAYLMALRGEVNSASKALDASRIQAFGLPEALPGDDPDQSPDARAEAFLRRLAQCIDKLDETDRVIAHHYFFGKGSAADRQRAAVDALGQGTPEARARNRQRKALEQLAGYLMTQEDDGPRQPNTDQLVSNLMRELTSAYPKGSRLEQLAEMVAPIRPIIGKTDVSLVLSDCPDNAELYHLRVTTSCSTPPGPYFIALTPRASLSDLLVTTCPQISEVFSCSSGRHVVQTAERWSTNDEVVLTAIQRDGQGRVLREPLSLALASDSEKTLALDGLPPSIVAEVALLRAEVPDGSADELPRLELRQETVMERRDHYCYWLADRPTFVRQLQADWTSLTLKDGHEIRLRPTVRGTAYEAREENRCCVLDINGWLVAGQGLVLIWG